MTLLGHTLFSLYKRAAGRQRVLDKHAPRSLWLCLALAMCLLLECDSAFALPVAWLKNVQPTVEVRAGGSGKWQPARERHRLQFGHYVRTVSRGKTLVLFNNGTQLLLSSGTQIQLVAPAKDNQPLIVRVFGTLSEVFVKAKGNTQIRTAAGTAAVRGTQYLVRVMNDTATEVTVTEGAVQFSNERGSVLLTANQQSRATVQSAPTPPVAVDPSGLIEWTADISGLPIEFEMPHTALSREALQTHLRDRARAVELNPDDAAVRAAFGEVLFDLGEYSQAVEQFSLAVSLQPDNAAWHVRLGQARHGQGNIPAALQAFERARELAPDDARARIGLAMALLSGGNQDAAQATVENLNDPTAQAVRGLITLRQGHTSESVAQLQVAVRSEPQLYQAHALLALALLSQNKLHEAEASARRAAEIAPQSAQAQGALAMTLFFGGRTEEASRAATKAVRLNPLSPFALLTQGRALLAQNQTDEARDALQRAQALAPDLPLIDTELGAVYLQLDMPQKAEAAYRRAMERNSESAEAHSGLAVALQKQGKTTAALAMHQQALRLAPNNSSVRSNLASFYLAQGDLDAASEQLQSGVLAAPERGILYVRLAELALYQQNLRAAQENARRAVQLLPRSALARYQLGRVYLEQDRVFQAEQQFRQAVILDPQFAEALYALGLTRSRTQTDLRGLALSAKSAFVGSPATVLMVQNLRSAGAPERIQGLSQDPAVPRVASRSYGNTEVSGRVGQSGSQDLEISHLNSVSGERGVVGVTVARNHEDGVRSNADYTHNELGFILGQKRQNSPSGFFLTGQIEESELGQNRALRPSKFARDYRYRAGLSRLLGGYTFSQGAGSRTRVLAQISEPYARQSKISDPDARAKFDFDRVNVEVRHDRRFGQRHLFTAGLFSGVQDREVRSNVIGIPTIVEARVRATGVYVRDEVSLSQRWKIIGEVGLQHTDLLGQAKSFLPPDTLTSRYQSDSGRVLPKLVLAYQPQERTGIRLRLRRLAGTIPDFQLLRPTDVFIELDDLPAASLFPNAGRNGTGRSAELEFDHTFKDASFLRVTLFDQDLDQAENGSIGTSLYKRVAQRGARLSYEGALNRDTSFFMRLTFNHARDALTGEDIVQVPRFGAGFGLHYLNRSGYFIEPLLLLQGKRLERRGSPTELDRFSVFNLRVGKRSGLRSSVFVEFNNILNSEYSVLRDRQPGRELRIGALHRF